MSRAVTEIATLKDLSPADATAKLAEMAAAFRKETPASDKLSGMLKDPAFLSTLDRGGAYGASDGTALPGGASFDKLQAAVADARTEAGDPVSRAIAGRLDDINDSGFLQQKQTADALRGMGVDDAAIRQVLAGQPVTRAEHDSVQRWKSEAMKDEKWRAAYLKGDADCVRQMTNAIIVLSSPIKDDAA